MELYFLRHAIAEPRELASAKEDSKRALTQEGARKMRRIAKAMKAMELSFDLILSSPFLRAKQTAEIVAEEFHLKKRLKLTRSLAAGSDGRSLIRELKNTGAPVESALLVGHEPDLSELISLLLAGEDGFSLSLKKGGLCKLTVESLHYERCARLDWLLTPAQLTRIR